MDNQTLISTFFLEKRKNFVCPKGLLVSMSFNEYNINVNLYIFLYIYKSTTIDIFYTFVPERIIKFRLRELTYLNFSVNFSFFEDVLRNFG